METTIDQNRLIALLLEEKLLNKKQVKEALSEQEKSHKPLPQILMDMKLVTPAVLSELQARVMGMDHVKINELRLDTNILKLLPKRYAVEHRAIPIGLSGNILTVAMEHPQDVLAIDEIKMLTGHNVRAVVCSPKDIESGLAQYPDEQTGELMVTPTAYSPARHAIQFTIFMILLVLPLIVLPIIATFRTEWIILLSNFDNLIILLVLWGIYSVILYYLYLVFFESGGSSSKKHDLEE